MTARLKYVKLTPEMVLTFMREKGVPLPADARILDKMAYDKETGNIVCLVESIEFAEVTGPNELKELI